MANDNQNNGAGRFAPSPTGRMHLGNVFTALLSWLDARSRNAQWILRIEDLDRQRSRRQWAEAIESDLRWLGLDWDQGGLGEIGPHAPYSQSLRDEFYQHAFKQLLETAATYPCRCTRADIMATQAPHQSDGRIIYSGTCRPASRPPFSVNFIPGTATRLFVPDKQISFTDIVMGPQTFNLARDCGDFIIRRADGAWSYQLAVVVDDALMGVGRVVRGCDLLLSAAQQIYLYSLLGRKAPEFMHLPLICNSGGTRLSKRDSAMSMEQLRLNFTPRQILGRLAHIAGIIPENRPAALDELLKEYSSDKIHSTTFKKIS